MGEKILARSGRVKVRRFRRGDQKERLAWPPYTEPLYTHLNYSLSTLIEREKWLLTRMTNAGRMYFAIEDENGRLIGEMSLREIDPAARTSRLGIHLACDKVGLGYGSEALAALVEYYFGTMGYNAMYLDVAAYNTRALKLYEHTDFQHLPTFWRAESAGLPIFNDERYAPVRRFFRRRGANIECLYYDMVLTKERYLASRAGDGAGGETARPPGNGDAKTMLFRKQG